MTLDGKNDESLSPTSRRFSLVFLFWHHCVAQMIPSQKQMRIVPQTTRRSGFVPCSSYYSQIEPSFALGKEPSPDRARGNESA